MFLLELQYFKTYNLNIISIQVPAKCFEISSPDFLPCIKIVSCLTYLRLSRSNYANKANLRMKLEITVTVTFSIRQFT